MLMGPEYQTKECWAQALKSECGVLYRGKKTPLKIIIGFGNCILFSSRFWTDYIYLGIFLIHTFFG
jgi:hypothetical protein